MSDNQKKLFEEFPPIEKQAWKDLIIKDLNGGDYNKKMVWRSIDGLETEPFYTGEDLKGINYTAAAPSSFPFVRGNKTIDNSWEICQSINASDVVAANAKAKEYITKGVQGIEFLLDFMDDADDFSKLLDGIDIESISLHFLGAHSYSILIELLKDYCKSKNIDTHKVKGSFNFDSFAYYLLNGEYYNSCSDNMNELKCLFDETAKHFSQFKVLTINGHHFHNAGASIVQELAFTLASAHEYLVKMLEKNLKAADMLPFFRLSFATGSSYFPEIAKIRAARLLWAYITRHYVPGNEELAQVDIHSVSSLWNKTIFDSYNNMLRSTTETMSAVLGGSNSINTLPFDATYKASDVFSERIARNIQHMLRDESYLDKVIDPGAGSYYIETLTLNIAQHTWELFRQIEDKGGFIKAMESGFIFEEIKKTATERYNLIASRRSSVLGVNQYPNLKETMVENITNPLPKHRPEKALKLFRGAQAFEEMRLATGNYVKEGGVRPKVYLVQYGNLSMRIARAQFSANLFGIAGFEIFEGPSMNNIEWTVNQIKEQKADIVVICSSDDEYGDIAPDLAKAIKNTDKDISVVVAGNPVEYIEKLKEAGVDDFISVKTNALEFLKTYQTKLGINE
jgi:methylmalonyl-CoA mutase